MFFRSQGVRWGVAKKRPGNPLPTVGERLPLYIQQAAQGGQEARRTGEVLTDEANMSVQGIATTFVATTQAQVQTAIAARLLKMAREIGAPQETLELVRQAADTAAQTLDATAASAAGGFDAYA